MKSTESLNLGQRLLHAKARVLLMLLSPVALALTLLVCVHLLLNSALALGVVEKQLDGLFAGGFHIGELRLGADPRHIEVYGVTLFDHDRDQVAYVEHLEARVKLLPLIQGNVYIESALIAGGDALVGFDDRGGFNILDAFYTGPAHASPPKKKTTNIAIFLEEVDVKDFDALIEFPDFYVQWTGMAIDNFSMSIGGKELRMWAETMSAKRGDTKFKPEMFGFKSQPEEGPPFEGAKPPLVLPIENLAVKHWDWAGNGFTIKRLDFTSGEMICALTEGSLELGGEAGMAYHGTLHVKLPAFATPVEYFTGPLLSSPLTITMGLDGVLGPEMSDNSHITSNLKVDLTPMKVMGLEFEKGLLDATLINRKLYLNNFLLEGYGGEIRLSPEVMGPLPPWLKSNREPPTALSRAYLSLLDLKYHLPIEIEGLQLNELIEAAVPGIVEAAVIPATGTLDATVTATGRLADLKDSERYEPLPGYHRVDVLDMVLSRPDEVISRKEAGVPARIIKIGGQVVMSEGHLKTERPLVVRLDGDEIEVTDMDFDLVGQSLKAGLSVEIAEVAPYAQLYGVEDVGGQLSVSLKTEGPLMDPDITEGRVVIRKPRVVGYPGEEISTRFSLVDGWLGIKETRALGEFGQFGAGGRVRIYRGSLQTPETNPRLDVSFDAPRINLAAVHRIAKLDLSLSGQARIESGRVTGLAKSPAIEAVLSTGPIVVADQPIHRIRAALDVKPEGVKLQDLDVMLHAKRGKIEGSVDWRFKGRMKTDIKVTDLNLPDILALSHAKVKGQIGLLDLDVVGALDLAGLQGTGGKALTPDDLVRWATSQKLGISGALEGKHLSVGTQRLGNVYGAWNTHDDVFSMTLAAIPHIPAEAARSLYTVEGGLSAESHFETVRDAYPPVLGLELRMPQALDEEISVTLNLDKLNVRGVLAGFLEQQIATEDAALAVGAWAEASARSIAATRARSIEEGRRVRQVPTKPRAFGTASSGLIFDMLGELTLTGGTVVHFFRDDMSWNVESRFSELSIAALGQKLSNIDEKKAQECVSKVLAEGAEVLDHEGEPMSAQAQCNQDVVLNFNGDALAIESLGLAGVELTGTVSLKADGRSYFDLDLNGALDMRLLNFMPEVYTEMRGKAGVSLSLDGHLSDVEVPELSGMLSLSTKSRDRLRFRLRSLDDDIEFESGMVVVCPSHKPLEGDRLSAWCTGAGQGMIIIPENAPLRMRLLDGTTVFSAEIPLVDSGLGHIEAKVRARNLSYHVPGTMDLTFHSALGISIPDVARPETWLVNGDVAVIDGRFYQNLSFLRQLGASRLQAAFGGGQASRFEGGSLESNPILSKMRLDMNIEIRDGFVVRSEIETATVDLELTARLSVKETVVNPNVVGNVTILQGGKIDFNGRDFVIREGDMTWTGNVTNPQLKVIAEASIPNSCAQNTESIGGSEIVTYQVVMNVDGPLQGNIGLELSSRPFADETDILILMLYGCTPDQLDASSASSPGLAIALQPIIGRVEKELGKYLNVEEVNISSDLEETRVQVSERITKRFIIRFDGAFGTDGAEQSFGGQYIILDNLLLEIGENSNDDEVKLDANIRLRIPLDE